MRVSSNKNDNNMDKPTPVTIANIKGSKKDRKNKYESVSVLIDTGCSDSIIHSKYSSTKIKENKKEYSTGGGVLKTEYETKIHFTLPEFSGKKK